MQLLVFPEALLGGYSWGAAFGALVGERTAAGRQEFLAYSRHAVTVPGPELEALCQIAVARGLYLMAGFVERAGMRLYCRAVIIDPGGDIVGRRRKVMPTGSGRLVLGPG